MQQRKRGPWLTAVIALVVSAAVACGRPRPTEQYPTEPDPTLPPTFDAAQIMSIPLDTIRAYAQRLAFDTVFGAADEQLVDFERGSIGTGNRARIEPEMGSYRLTESALAQGRIIARIWSDKEVPAKGFGPRWTWWWVDKRGPGDTFRSVFIAESEKPGTRITSKDSLIIERHPRRYGRGYWRQAIARFKVYSDSKPGGDPFLITWGTCGDCCSQRL